MQPLFEFQLNHPHLRPTRRRRWCSTTRSLYGTFSSLIQCPKGNTSGLNFNIYLSSLEGDKSQDKIDFEFLGKDKTIVQTNYYTTVNDLHGLISPVPQGTPLPLVLLGKSKNMLLSTFLFVDQIVWLVRSGIYKNKERAELLSRISLFCWMGSLVCTTLVKVGELGRFSASMKKLEKELKNSDKHKKSNKRSLALVKAAMDIVVAFRLLQLAPKKVTPHVTGGFGFVSSLISCYQLLPAPAKSKVT